MSHDLGLRSPQTHRRDEVLHFAAHRLCEAGEVAAPAVRPVSLHALDDARQEAGLVGYAIEVSFAEAVDRALREIGWQACNRMGERESTRGSSRLSGADASCSLTGV